RHLYLGFRIRRYGQDVRINFARQLADRIDEQMRRALPAFNVEEVAVKLHRLDAPGKIEGQEVEVHESVDALVLDHAARLGVADIDFGRVDPEVFLREGGRRQDDHGYKGKADHAACSSSSRSSKKADHSLSG